MTIQIKKPGRNNNVDEDEKTSDKLGEAPNTDSVLEALKKEKMRLKEEERLRRIKEYEVLMKGGCIC